MNTNMRRGLVLLVLFLVITSLVYASGKQEEVTTVKKTDLVVGITKDINGLDPNNPGNTLTAAIQGNMYDWLLVRDEDDNIMPGLVDSWEQLDTTTWSFHLREDVKFHSGNPLTSEDVKFSIERVQQDKMAQRSNYIKIKEVRIVDDHTFLMVTDGPDPILLNRLSRLGGGIIDSKLFAQKGENEYLKSVSGTGAYKLKSWVKDTSIVLERNPDYYGETPKWDTVTFKVIPEASTRTAELLTGGVDIALDLSSTDIARVNANRGTHVEAFTTKRVIYWLVRTSTAGLDDVRVRQAIDYAIDDQTLLDVLYNGSGTVVQTIVAEGVFGASESHIGTYKYDLEKAKALLVEAGQVGLSFELASGNGQYPKDRELTELVAAMLTQAGFAPQVNIMDTSRFTEIKNARGFTGLRMNGYSSSMSDAGTDLVHLTQPNPVQLTDWHNAEFDSLYAQTISNMDSASRRRIFVQLQGILEEELPMIPMFQVPGFYGVSDLLDYQPRMDEYLYVDQISLKH